MQALEVMEQCRVENRRTGEKAMANIKVFNSLNHIKIAYLCVCYHVIFQSQGHPRLHKADADS